MSQLFSFPVPNQSSQPTFLNFRFNFLCLSGSFGLCALRRIPEVTAQLFDTSLNRTLLAALVCENPADLNCTDNEQAEVDSSQSVSSVSARLHIIQYFASQVESEVI